LNKQTELEIKTAVTKKAEQLQKWLNNHSSPLAEGRREGDCFGGNGSFMIEESSPVLYDKNTKELRKIEKVLSKIEQGTLELCSDCGAVIPMERLKTMAENGGYPVLFCLECQPKNISNRPVMENHVKRPEEKEGKNKKDPIFLGA